jgi:hypothetical protein
LLEFTAKFEGLDFDYWTATASRRFLLESNFAKSLELVRAKIK